MNPIQSKYLMILFGILTLVFFLAIVRLITVNFDGTAYWGGDYAIFLIDMHHASFFSQLLGISSRFGWAHPGPLNYYLLLPGYLISQESEYGLLLGTLVINFLLIMICYLIIKKLSSQEISGLFLVIATLLITIAVGQRVYIDPLIPFSTLFVWFFSICVSCAVILNRMIWIYFLTIGLSFVMQAHVGFWLPGIILYMCTIVLALHFHGLKRKNIFILLFSFLFGVFLWIPSLLEYSNLEKILIFFLNKTEKAHSIIDASHAFLVLLSEPLLGRSLQYPAVEWTNFYIFFGIFLIVAILIATIVAFIKRLAFAQVLGVILIFQFIACIYALSRYAGPIMPHSITYISVYPAFIILLLLLVISSYQLKSIQYLSIISVFGVSILIGRLLFLGKEEMAPLTNKNEVIFNLYNELQKKLALCKDPTLIIEHNVWPYAVGAISYAYRKGIDFNVMPEHWSIIFGGRIPIILTDCQLKFISQNGKPLIHASTLLYKQKNFDLSSLQFTTWGKASFNIDQYFVKSDDFTDAALVTNQVTLSRGDYKLKLSLSYSVESEDSRTNAAHISMHGKKILIPINTSSKEKEPYEVNFFHDGEPFQLSIGLGGWSKGRGVIKINSLEIFSITRKDL